MLFLLPGLAAEKKPVESTPVSVKQRLHDLREMIRGLGALQFPPPGFVVKFDKDKDGQLTKAEFYQSVQDSYKPITEKKGSKSLLKVLDQNHDDVVSPLEFDGASKILFHLFDRNDDGVLEQSEILRIPK